VRRPQRLPLVVALAALAAFLPPGAAVLRAPAVAATWILLPGLLLARRLAPADPAAWRTLLALCWSPLLTGGLTALLAALGVPVAQGARLTAGAIAAWALVEAFLGAPASEPANPARVPDAEETAATAPSSAPWWLAIAGAGGVLLLHLLRPTLAQRSDGAFHAAVTLSVLRTGVPPEDPFFAGLRLFYFWGPHVWAAGWLALVPGLAPWTPFVAMAVAATAVGLLAVGLLARRLGAGPGGVALAGALALFGAAPFAWIWVVARATTGAMRGMGEVRRMLGDGVDPALRVMSPGLLHPSLVLPADKFIVLTPFALGIGASVALVLALLRVAERPGARSATVLGITVAAVLFAHPVAAMATLASGSLAWLLLVDRALGRDRGAFRAAVGAAVAVVAACLAMSPYLNMIEAGPYQSAPGFGFPAPGARALWSLFVGGALVVPVAGWWLGTRCTARNARAALLATSALLATGALFFEIRGDNQSKLLNLLFFLLSPAAALGWLELRRRAAPATRALIAPVLLAAIVPTLACCAWAYWTESPESADFPQGPGPRGRALLATVAGLAPPQAVLVDATLDSSARSPAAPRLADRSLLWSGWYMARKWGYPPAELEARERAALDLAHGRMRGADSLLASMGREAWVLAPVPPEPGAFAPPRWREVGQDGGYGLYRLAPEPH